MIDKLKGSATWLFKIINEIRIILEGDFLLSDILVKQWKYFGLLIAIAFFYINNRYASLQIISDIGKMKRELTDLKFEAVTKSTELMSISKQSQIQKVISERGVELETSKTPPIVISR